MYVWVKMYQKLAQDKAPRAGHLLCIGMVNTSMVRRASLFTSATTGEGIMNYQN